MTSNGPHDESDLFDELERRAFLEKSPEQEQDDSLAEQEAEAFDVTRILAGESVEAGSADITLGGYISVHDRVPAFEGRDGQPYTVDIDTEETGDPDRPVSAFLVFVRWAATGAGIMDHVESGDIAHGATADEAKQAALDMSLYEIKAELDAAIERKRRRLGD